MVTTRTLLSRRKKASPLYVDVKTLGRAKLLVIARECVISQGPCDWYERVRESNRGKLHTAPVHNLTRLHLAVIWRCAEAAGDAVHKAKDTRRDAERLRFLVDAGAWNANAEAPARETIRAWRALYAEVYGSAEPVDFDRAILLCAAQHRWFGTRQDRSDLLEITPDEAKRLTPVARALARKQWAARST